MADNEKHVVLVSRMWDSPNISISVTGEGIHIAMGLKDFIKAVTQQAGVQSAQISADQLSEITDELASRMGNPTLLVSKAALLSKMRAAAVGITLPTAEVTTEALLTKMAEATGVVVSQMKAETARVM